MTRDQSPTPQSFEPRCHHSRTPEFVPPASVTERCQSAAPVVQAVHRELTKHPVVLRGRHKPGAQMAFNLHSSPRSPAWRTPTPQTSSPQSSSGRLFRLSSPSPSLSSSAYIDRKPPKPPSGYRPNSARTFTPTLVPPDRPQTAPATTGAGQATGVRRRGMHKFWARVEAGVEECLSAPLGHQVRWYRDCARGDTGTAGEKPIAGTGWWPTVASAQTMPAAVPSELYAPLVVPRAPPARPKPAVRPARQQAAVCPKLTVCVHCSQVVPQGVAERRHAEACPGGSFKGNRFGWYPSQSKYSTHQFHQEQVSGRASLCSQ